MASAMLSGATGAAATTGAGVITRGHVSNQGMEGGAASVSTPSGSRERLQREALLPRARYERDAEIAPSTYRAPAIGWEAQDIASRELRLIANSGFDHGSLDSLHRAASEQMLAVASGKAEMPSAVGIVCAYLAAKSALSEQGLNTDDMAARAQVLASKIMPAIAYRMGVQSQNNSKANIAKSIIGVDGREMFPDARLEEPGAWTTTTTLPSLKATLTTTFVHPIAELDLAVLPGASLDPSFLLSGQPSMPGRDASAVSFPVVMKSDPNGGSEVARVLSPEEARELKLEKAQALLHLMDAALLLLRESGVVGEDPQHTTLVEARGVADRRLLALKIGPAYGYSEEDPKVKAAADALIENAYAVIRERGFDIKPE